MPGVAEGGSAEVTCEGGEVAGQMGLLAGSRSCMAVISWDTDWRLRLQRKSP